MRSKPIHAEHMINAIDERFILEAGVEEKASVKFKILKRVTAAACAAVILTTGIGVAAATNDSAYQMLYHVAPALAQQFQPIHEKSLQNGILMEVISAEMSGDTAQFYIAVTDTEGDRIDATTDLFDSYEINCPFDSIGHCENLGYDEETKTATFLATISRMDKQPMKGGKITFSVREMLSKKQNQTHWLIGTKDAPLTWENLIEDEGMFFHKTEVQETNNCMVMTPNETPLCSPQEGVEITGMGYHNGQLHIQVHYTDVVHFDNHGWVWLVEKDRQGAIEQNILAGDGGICWDELQEECVVLCKAETFRDEAKKGYYYEYIFDVEKEKLSDYALIGEFVTTTTNIKGNWTMTFALENQAKN